MLRLIGNQFRKPTGLLGKITSRIMIKNNTIEYDQVIPELEIKQNDRILEIGYGHGIGVDKILSNYDCFISGIDFSKLMFKEATKRNKKYIESKKAELFYGNFLSTEMAPDSYNKVFCLNVIYFWDKLEEPFLKIKTLLKEDGVLCMYMAHKDYINKMKFTKDDIFNKYTIEEVLDKLKSVGFEDISYHFENNGYIIKCRK
ncbi:MAG: class I SAM-dependent methyltransferase [Lentimicrobiaceae bacterium]|jgi:cyclopropane fatty-acyl-phospholipid synthase-like methyltransferase|nr:class I SAM-dependent methyltransferase [Lentimicrobiaceae bacterium]